jgi:hypothetical protein
LLLASAVHLIMLNGLVAAEKVISFGSKGLKKLAALVLVVGGRGGALFLRLRSSS